MFFSIFSIRAHGGSKEFSTIIAEITLKAAAETLGVQDRLFLVHTLADYFHLDPSLVTMSTFRSKVNKHLWNLPVLAEDPRQVIPLQGHSVQFHWSMEHVSTALPELMQVFQQHASSKYLAQILGYKIEGWRLLQKSQRRPRQLRAIPVPTVGPNEMMRKPNNPFSVSLPTLVTPWIPKDEAPSISGLFAALRQITPILHPAFIPGTPRYTKMTRPLHTVASQNSLKEMSLTTNLEYSFAFPEVLPSMVLTATSFTDSDFLQSRTSTVSVLLEKLDLTEWEIRRHTPIHGTRIQKHPVSSHLVSESVSQPWYSRAFLASSKYSHFPGSSVSEEVIQDVATPSEGLSSMTTFLCRWSGSHPVYLGRFVQSPNSLLIPAASAREILAVPHFPLEFSQLPLSSWLRQKHLHEHGHVSETPEVSQWTHSFPTPTETVSPLGMSVNTKFAWDSTFDSTLLLWETAHFSSNQSEKDSSSDVLLKTQSYPKETSSFTHLPDLLDSSLSELPKFANAFELPESMGSKTITHFLSDWYSGIEHLAFSKFSRTSQTSPGNTMFNLDPTGMVVSHPHTTRNLLTRYGTISDVNNMQGKIVVVA